jgi:hypothetical protein
MPSAAPRKAVYALLRFSALTDAAIILEDLLTTAVSEHQPERYAENDARRYLGFGDSPVGVTTPPRGGPDMQPAWLNYFRRRSIVRGPEQQ